MKTIQSFVAVTILAVSATANASEPFANNNNGYRQHAVAPLTAEEMKTRRAAFEKSQKEAFERHQEAMKSKQSQAAVTPDSSAMPADAKVRRDAFMKDVKERRVANEKRRQAMTADMQARRDAFRATAEKRREEMKEKHNKSETSETADKNS